MRFLQVHTFYPQYLDALYARVRHLDKASFGEQMDLLVADAFSGVHMIAPYMNQCGYDGRLVVANCHQAQVRWLQEHGNGPLSPDNWIEEIPLRQIEEFEPDILYLSDPVTFEGNFLRKLRHKPKLVIGWRGAAFPPNIDWNGFDIMLSSLEPLLDHAVQCGARAGEMFFPGFPPKFFERIKRITPTIDMVFVGQYTLSQHAKRGYYLRKAALNASQKGYSCALHLSGQTRNLPDEIKPFVRPPAYGMDMHKALRSGRIAFDSRADHFIIDPLTGGKIDIGGKNTANMRIIEATGSGVFLLTEHFPNITEHFNVGKEIETFADSGELIDKIDYYLAHPEERKNIALCGKERCLLDHSMDKRVLSMDAIIKKHIKLNKNFNPETINTDKQQSTLYNDIIINGSLSEVTNYLHVNHTKFQRRVSGKIVIDGNILFFADLHSFYHELDQIFNKNLYTFEPESNSPVILDCGAHVGLASIDFALRYPHAEIHSFEADPSIFALFEQNVRSMGLETIHRHGKAVWVHDQGVSFALSGDDSGHIENSAATTLPSVRLRDVIEKMDRVDLLKLDVEGAEFSILQDCRDVLDRVRQIIVEVHMVSNTGVSLAELLGVLEQARFCYAISDLHSATWLPMNSKPPFAFLNHDKYILTVFAWKNRIEKVDDQKKNIQNESRPKIAQFCMQDYGGAGTAALRLHDGLFALGMNSTLHVHNIQRWKDGTTLLSKTQPASTPGSRFVSPDWQAFQVQNSKCLVAYPHRPAGLEIFSDTWAATRLTDIPELVDADIIHLHWISGTVSIPQDVEFLKAKKIVWTLHDMNAFTGGCHYSAGCQGYEKYCGACPQLGSQEESDLSREVWKRKKVAYKQLDMTIVTPSEWLAKCARKSSLLSSLPVHVIPYGLPTDVFKPLSQARIREPLQVPEESFLILFGADSVSNARKGFVYLLRALEKLKTHDHDQEIVLAVFGHHAEASVRHMGFKTFGFDYVEKESELALIYSMADVTVIPSLEDNLPNIVLESLACGTPVVGFDVGGIPDMVEHRVDGYLAPVGDAAELAQGIRWIMEQKQGGGKIRLKCRETALSRYNLPLQAKLYQELYHSIVHA